MATIFGGFESWQGAATILKYVGYGFLFLIGALIFVAFIIFVLVKGKDKKVYEISSTTRIIKEMSGRESRGKAGKIQIWIGKLKKFMPKVQQEDLFLQKRKEAIMLMKDNNGLHHTLRLPSYKELKKWYSVVHGVDLDTVSRISELQEKIIELEKAGANPTFIEKIKDRFRKHQEFLKIVGTVFFLPNPAEDLNWLAHQFKESDREFPSAWYKNPVVIIMGSLVLSAFVFIITLIVAKKM